MMVKISNTKHVTKKGVVKRNPVKINNQLDVLRRNWMDMSHNIYKEKFKQRFIDYNAVIGAGVEIIKDNMIISKWSGTGMTGEQEAFDIIRPKIEALGFRARYNPGRLD